MSEKLFKWVLRLSAIGVLLLIVAMGVSLFLESLPSIKAFGFKFLWGKSWNPNLGLFGALPFIVGTLLTSFLALVISLPFSLAISLFLGEYFRSGILYNLLSTSVELLAGVPSIIFGFWGLFVLVPLVRSLELKFGIPPYGVGIFTASLILSIMIIPYSASIGRDVISMVPQDLKEAAYSFGATRFEVVRHVVMPYARSGIFAGVLLSLGRALGETMAVTMVVGNSNFIPRSIFSPGNTMASVIANEFTEASGKLYLSSLIEIGLLLFFVTAVFNILGRFVIKKFSTEVS